MIVGVAQSLSLSRFNESLQGIPEAAAGTCSWILDCALFKTWLQKSSGILWLQGKAGSGKSTLLRFVAQQLLDKPTYFGLDSAVSLYFFSFSHGEARSTWKEIVNILQNFLLDCLQQGQIGHSPKGSAHSSEVKNTEAQSIRNRKPPFELSKRLSTARYALFPRPTAIFIDGLDGHEECAAVTTYIGAIISQLPVFYSLRVFISSRRTPQLGEVARIRLEDNNTADIRSYCQSRLMTNDLVYRDFLAQEIVNRANGVFLWVKLVVSQLGHLHSRVDFGQIQLPLDLTEALGWTMDRVMKKGHDAGPAKSLLRWAMFARRPLSIYEMRHALGATSFICSHVCEDCCATDTKPTCFIDEDEFSQSHAIIGLEVLTCGLLEVVDNTVCFTHYSVKDHLLKRITTQERFDESHQELAFTCLGYLKAAIPDLGDTLQRAHDSIRSTYPFLKYATYYWMDHLRFSGPLSELSTHQALLQEFLSPTSIFRDGWITIYNCFFSSTRFNPQKTTPLHIVCCFGIPLPNNQSCEVYQYFNARDHVGRTPLSLACEMGHVDLCRRLIMAGADHHIRDEIYGQTALGWAVAHGHTDIVQLLLNEGADPKDHVSGTTPLHLAIQQLDITLVELLLQNGADARALDNYTGQSALSLASSLGDTSMVSLLLDRGAEALGKDHKSEWTPLHHAVSRGHLPALKALVSVLSETQTRDFKYKNLAQPYSWVDRVLIYSLCGVYCQGSGEANNELPYASSGKDAKRRITNCSNGRYEKRRNKRLQDASNSEDEDEDENDTQRRRKVPRSPICVGQRLSCPYQKIRPEEYSCSQNGFLDMYRVK